MRNLTVKQRQQIEAERETLLYLHAVIERIAAKLGGLPGFQRKLTEADWNAIQTAYDAASSALTESNQTVRKAKSRVSIIQKDGYSWGDLPDF